MKDLATLTAVGREIVSDLALQPIRNENGRIVVTHCNEGAERVAQALGCAELDGLMADQQYAVMDENRSGLWLKVDGEAAALHARDGGLAFAAMTSELLTERGAAAAEAKGEPEPAPELHGHIAAVAPDALEWSGSLAKNVPMIFNVGKTDAEEKESLAFPVADGEPDYFVWQG